MANEYTASELNKILGVANGAELLSGKPKATPKELRGYVVKIIVRNMHK